MPDLRVGYLAVGCVATHVSDSCIRGGREGGGRGERLDVDYSSTAAAKGNHTAPSIFVHNAPVAPPTKYMNQSNRQWSGAKSYFVYVCRMYGVGVGCFLCYFGVSRYDGVCNLRTFWLLFDGERVVGEGRLVSCTAVHARTSALENSARTLCMQPGGLNGGHRND